LRSTGENKIAALLKENNISFEQEKILLKNYRFDFYVNNLYIIEYDGIQHFEQRENRELLNDIH
jgi:very-short-patch-repair endonuclease